MKTPLKDGSESATKRLLKRFDGRMPPTPIFIASAENLCAVTVRQLEKNEESGEWLVQIIVQLFNPNNAECRGPDRWDAHWVHFKNLLRENFWRYMREHCPDIELVEKAVANLQLPEELKDLFEETKS